MHVAVKYLGDRQRAVEMLSALYAAWYACATGIQVTWMGASPLGWAGFTRDDHLVFAWFLLLAAVVHGIGIDINGKKWWSPLLRVAGLFMHTLAIVMILVRAGIDTSAASNYSFVVGLLVFGLRNASGDALRAWRNYGRIPT